MQKNKKQMLDPIWNGNAWKFCFLRFEVQWRTFQL